jgi:type II secretory pathway pseudopilin PulG
MSGVRGSISSTAQQRGYILLTLLLTVTLLAIAFAVVAPSIAFQIRRDREEELVHRGAQYSRGIRLYAKKTGHFPVVMEELYDPGGQKYIRKLYKDPVTGRDFRLLHTADIMLANPQVDSNKSQPPTSGSQNAVSPNAVAGDSAQDDGNAANSSPQPNGTPNSASTDSRAASGAGLAPDDPTRGLIFGVASISKSRSIREFDHKNHYNQWLFFYDLSHDSGQLITGPTSLTPPTKSLQGQSPVAAGGSSSGPSPTPPAPAQQ